MELKNWVSEEYIKNDVIHLPDRINKIKIDVGFQSMLLFHGNG